MTIGDQFSLFDDVPGISNPETGLSDPGALGTSIPEMGTTDPSASLACPPGHQLPRNGHPAPRVAGGDQLHAFDWSIARGVAAVDPDGYEIRVRDLETLIRIVPRGATVVGEATFESYDPRKRQQVIELAESRDITLLTVPARGNTWRRRALELPEKTSQSRRTDLEDARAIQYAARNGAHLKRPAETDPDWCELRDRARKRFVYLRRSGQKDAYAKKLLRHLGPFTWQPTERRIALGPSGGYNLIIVAAVGVAAEFVSSRSEFERLTGLYAHGYPSQFRSDLMHWGWGKRPDKRERISLSIYRRELRWMFYQLKGGDANEPSGSRERPSC